jgi:hypothetical protein
MGIAKIRSIIMKDKMINWLQNWVFQNCDGKWGKINRIFLRNIDNPGWLLTLQLANSRYENKHVPKMKIDRTENDWCHCFIDDEKFVDTGGPCNLNEMLNYFKDFVEDVKEVNNPDKIENEIINWFQKWYHDQCDGYWEDSERIMIKTTETGWYFSFYLEDTFYKNNFSPIEVKKSQNDWYKCYLDEYRFIGMGGIFNLIDILKTFKQWAEKQQSNF